MQIKSRSNLSKSKSPEGRQESSRSVETAQKVFEKQKSRGYLEEFNNILERRRSQESLSQESYRQKKQIRNAEMMRKQFLQRLYSKKNGCVTTETIQSRNNSITFNKLSEEVAQS